MLADYDTLKAYLGLHDSQKDLAERMSRAAQAEAERMAGRPLEVGDVTAYAEGTGARELMLGRVPVQSVSSVTVGGVEVTDYRIEAQAGYLYRRGGWPDGAEIVVEYQGGYKTEEELALPGDDPVAVYLVPDDLVQALVEVVSWNLGRFNAGTIGNRSVQSGEVTTTLSLTIPPSAAAVFRGYKLWDL